MDYNEWLLDVYTIKFAPLTSTEGFSSFVALIAAGTLFTTFGSIVFGFYNDQFLAVIMPAVSAGYNDSFYVPSDEFLEGTIAPFFSEYGLDPVTNIIDQAWEGLNYVIIEVIFAYLAGDLTSDPNYD